VTAIVVGLLVGSGCAAQRKDDTTPGAANGGAPAAVNGFDPAAGTITVGDILALSGPIAATAKEQLVGQQTWFDQINAKGGIGGKYKIKLVTADNQYNAQLAVQAYQQIQQQVVMLSGVLGTDSVNALLPLLERTSGVVVPSAQDAAFRTSPALLPIFPSYQTNVVNAISYLHGKNPGTQPVYCALVMDNPWGAAATQGLTYITGKYGTTVKTVAKFGALDTAFAAQIQQLKSNGCTVVVFGGAANNLPSMVAAATQLSFNPQWTAEFIANSTAFKKSPAAQYLTAHVLFTGPGAKLDDESIPAIAALRKALGSTELTVQYVYGYMQAIATTTLLEQAVKNGDLSGPGLRKALAQLKELSFDGLGTVALGEPNQRTLNKSTTLYAYNTTAPSGLDAVSVQYRAPEGSDPNF
jgi:ABC-type branched-subunit amino acid transport system substrate-binding protein